MSKSKQSGALAGGISASRKMEILGILIMAIATLIGLSIVTYHSSDYAMIQSLTTDNIFSVDRGPALRIQNGLGVVGAYISYLFVYQMFGYTSIILPVIIFGYGWYVFRGRSVQNLVWATAYGLWSMVLISSILGWFYNEFVAYSSIWPGASGIALASLLQNLTGIGSIIILSVLFVVTFLVLLDRDLQYTVEVVKGWVDSIRESMEERKQDRDQRKKENQEEKQRQQKIKEQQRAEQKMSRQSESASHSSAKNSTGPVSHHQQSRPNDRSIDDIVEASEQEDERRRQEEREEIKSLDQRPRAILDKSKTQKVADEEIEEDDDVEVSVYVGEGDEQAADRELDRKNRDKAREVPEIKYKFPGIDILDAPPNEGNEVDLDEIKENKRIILDKLKRHKIEIRSINAIVGPTVTLYELDPAPDVKISKIESYANDLKMATAAHGLRIIAPIPGRSAVGIEVPNRKRETVFIKSVINTKKFVETDAELPIAFGKTIENEVFLRDLTKMPHLLIAGATGSGKTVGINTIITCLLYKCHPDNLKFVMIDPKKIELSLYRNIEKHFLATLPGMEEPIITDTSDAQELLESLTMEMDERYDLMKMAMVRDIKDYNKKFDNGELDEELDHRHLPYIVVVIDELADLMMTAGKQIEEPIARLAQLARAVGIHLVVATQRPSVNVITGTIKANFPARVAYQVASEGGLPHHPRYQRRRPADRPGRHALHQWRGDDPHPERIRFH
ncbi:MAG: DNA translocase FtsK [Balneolaceae bacterium]|nr:DNA translocase FtsK [Balneolaceae bacterium]